MSGFSLLSLRLAGAAGAAALIVGVVPAMAQTAPMSTTDCSEIHFDMANPSPGSFLEPGGLVLQGVAMDTRAPEGSLGIDRVDFFLDSRDQGGLSLGTTVPGAAPGPLGFGSFSSTVTLPRQIGGHNLVSYAHSSVTGQESVITVPISIGEDPVTAGISMSATESCSALPAAAASSSTTSSSSGATTSTTAPATTASAPASTTAPIGTTTIVVEVSNPSPGDVIRVGGYSIEGLAWDKASQSGSGIDHIDIFLDSRDDGGKLLSQPAVGAGNMWHSTVDLPANQQGLHTLYFYVHSAVSGQTAVVSVPVDIEP